MSSRPPPFAVLLALFALFASGDAAVSQDLPIAERARVVEVVDGDTVVLSNGSEIRLVGTQAPKLPLGRSGFPIWPLAEEARELLVELVEGREVGLAFGGSQVDRHGRLLAQLYRSDDGLWVQGEMVGRGFARVYGFADNRALLPELLARERQARAAKLGIWRLSFYAIRRAEDVRGLAEAVDSFQLVEGRVLEVGEVRGRAFLNFGQDWKTDFTAMLAPQTLTLFVEEGHDVAALAGRRIRVRGWIELYNGPEIEVTHPEQIEVLE